MRGSIITAFCIIIAVGILHLGGIYLHLYWRLFWFDWIVHTLGGLWISVVTLSLLPAHIRGGAVRSVGIGIIAAAIMGILWEIFEVKVGAALVEDPVYVVDTVTDMVLDIGGGIIGSLYMIWKPRKQF